MTLSRDDLRTSIVAGTGEERIHTPIDGRAVSVFNAVGSWRFTFPADSWLEDVTAEADGAAPRLRIYSTETSEAFMSGPMTTRRRGRSGGALTVKLAGRDDNVWLARRVAHPEPASAAPTGDNYGTSHHSLTGKTSAVLRSLVDVNAGPGAVTRRQVDGLTLAADADTGRSATWRSRWQPLLERLQQVAAYDGLTFDTVDLEFTARAPRVTGIEFGEQLNNVNDWEHITQAPEATYGYGLGQGELTARTVAEIENSTRSAQWGIGETIRNDTSADNVAQLEAALEADLAVTTVSVAAQLVDTDRGRIGIDYWVGDSVDLYLPDEDPFTAPVSTAVLEWSASGIYANPTVGGISGGTVVLPPDYPQIFRRVSDLGKRLTRLEGAT